MLRQFHFYLNRANESWLKPSFYFSWFILLLCCSICTVLCLLKKSLEYSMQQLSVFEMNFASFVSGSFFFFFFDSFHVEGINNTLCVHASFALVHNVNTFSYALCWISRISCYIQRFDCNTKFNLIRIVSMNVSLDVSEFVFIGILLVSCVEVTILLIHLLRFLFCSCFSLKFSCFFFLSNFSFFFFLLVFLKFFFHSVKTEWRLVYFSVTSILFCFFLHAQYSQQWIFLTQ